jgi:hypothetical protein
MKSVGHVTHGENGGKIQAILIKKNNENRWLVGPDQRCQDDNEMDLELTGSRLLYLQFAIMFVCAFIL